MTEVVAALIWDNHKFLICQRPASKADSPVSKNGRLVPECGIDKKIANVYLTLTLSEALLKIPATFGIIRQQ